jgi:hypothetical protein
MKIRLTNVIAILSMFLICACGSDYDKLVRKELASDVRYDDIFYGLKLGQPRSEFYDICWEYNKKKLFIHGPSNNSVQVMLIPQDTTKTTEKIRMLFYGKFSNEKKMIGMDIDFSYYAWAPWNKDLSAQKLLPRIQDTLMKWYPGNDFMKVNDVLVKVDGNRQIRLKTKSDQDVSVIIEDLAYKYYNL